MKLETIKLDLIIPNDKNPKLMSPKEEADLMDSIKEFGVVDPLIINMAEKRKYFLVNGHQRYSILKKLGHKETPCVFVNIPDEDKEMELIIRLSKNTGSWDWEKLHDIEIDKLLQVGFGDEELSDLWDDVGTFQDDFTESEGVKEARTTEVKPGEIYELGKHRLMCGDSTLIDNVKKLMGEDKADMIYCDPPYNIGMDYDKGFGLYHKNQNYGGEQTSKDDSKKKIDYKDFVAVTIKNALAVTKDNAHVFYWCDQNFIWLVQQLFRDNDLLLRRVCLWVKNNMNLKPQTAFNKIYEPVVYATKGQPFLNKGMTKLHEIINKEVATGNRVYDEVMDYFDLWLVQRDVDYLHPTQKPLTLHEKPLKRCTAPGHIVLDLFGGSGSTLIACEQLNRKCYTMEKDPVFTQVIINRYEQHTGNKAKRID